MGSYEDDNCGKKHGLMGYNELKICHGRILGDRWYKGWSHDIATFRNALPMRREKENIAKVKELS